MTLRCRTLCLIFALTLMAPFVWVPDACAQKSDEPIDISADESLEWHKDTGLYYARGGARAVVKGTTIEADVLTARQRQKTSPATGGAIDQLTAEGNVKIHDARQQAFGDRGVYDVDAQIFRLTGANLKYVTDKNTVTAKDSFVFYKNEDRAVATGRALAESDGNRLEADTLTAQFARDAGGQLQMQTMTGKGRVLVVTRDGGIARGDRAEYDAQREVAILYDNVRITRGQTHLAGGKAEVDFKTGQSKLLSGGGGRVRVLLPSGGDVKGGKGTP